MNDYDGLDLPQLMQQMHTVVEPQAITFTPQTAGWWVLAGLLLVLALYWTWRIVRARRRNRYRREALAALMAIEKHAQPGPATGLQIAVLLKRTALAAYPRAQVAALHGRQWAQFLCQTSDDDAAIKASAEALASAAYRQDVEAAPLIAPARRWIERHHV